VSQDEEEEAKAIDAQASRELGLDEARYTFDCRLCTKTRMDADEMRDHAVNTSVSRAGDVEIHLIY
jgi:hypothetical protein